mgnify:CR=1 FL=1
MRIAIPSDGDNLDSFIFEHFGRAPFYIIVDIEKDRIVSYKAIRNPSYERHMPGEIPSLLANNNVDILIVRGIGPRAIIFFNQYGIKVIRGAEGRIREIIEKFLRNELEDIPYRPERKWHEE